MNRLPLLLLIACGGHGTQPAEPPSNHPSPTPTPVPVPAGQALLGWPVAPYTKAQITEVKTCEIEKTATTRYPKTMKLAELPKAFTPQTICDQATLAGACGMRGESEGEPTDACVAAYVAAVKANPAFAWANELTGPYFGKVQLVAAPTKRALVGAVLAYEWGGLGNPVAWTITARDLAKSPSIQVTGANAKPVKSVADATPLVAALGTSLASFMPIPKPIQAIDCTDNYPKWTANLEFDDGTKLALTTEGSNLIGLGGPWQMTVGNTSYMQLSPDFVGAIVKLVKGLDLPIGEPMGSTCRGYDLQAEILTP